GGRRGRHHRRAQLPEQLLRLGSRIQLPRPRPVRGRAGGGRDGRELRAVLERAPDPHPPGAGRRRQAAAAPRGAAAAARALREARARGAHLARRRRRLAGGHAGQRIAAGGGGGVHRGPASEAPARLRRRGALHPQPARAHRGGARGGADADALPGARAAGAGGVPRAARTRGAAAGSRGSRPRPLEREYSALRWSGFSAHERVPLTRGGVRFGLHSKSLVVDGRVGVVGTHNFDPRGDNYNTESAVVIEDRDFALALADSIRRDMAPANAWTVAPRDRPPVLAGLDYSLGKVSEALPLFDFWPNRYATSYEFRPGPGCPEPPPPGHPRFRACHVPVGDFPEVRLGLKGLLTRIFTAFGAGLAPIL